MATKNSTNILDAVDRMSRICENAIDFLTVVDADAQTIQTILSQLWDAGKALFPSIKPPDRPTVTNAREGIAAIEGLWGVGLYGPSHRDSRDKEGRARIGTIAKELSELEFDSKDTVWEARPEGTLDPATEPFGSPRYGPLLTVAHAMKLLAAAGGLYNVLRLTLVDDPAGIKSTESYRRLVVTLTVHRLWMSITEGRDRLRHWGHEIIEARKHRLFESQGRSFPTACHAVQWIAESELAEAWKVRWGVVPPVGEEEWLFVKGGRLPPFFEDRWREAVPALARHFSARGDVWSLIGEASTWKAGLLQEVTGLQKLAACSGTINQHHAILHEDIPHQDPVSYRATPLLIGVAADRTREEAQRTSCELPVPSTPPTGDRQLAERTDPGIADVLPALLSARELARKTGLNNARVESTLRRYRENRPDCYTLNDSPRRNEPKYLYRVSEVLPMLQKLRQDS